MKKIKVISRLICLSFIFVLLGVNYIFADALYTGDCDIWLGNERISVVDGTWSTTGATYEGNQTTGTLTLDNYTFNGTGYNNVCICNQIPNLTIDLKGVNTINITNDASKNSFVAGINNATNSFASPLTVIKSSDGTGSLKITTGYSPSYTSYGITGGNVSIENADITIVTGEGSKNGQACEGILVGSLNITNSKLNVSGGDAKNKSYAIESTGSLNISKSTINATSGNSNSSYGIVGDIVIDDSEVTATSGDVVYNTYAMQGLNSMTINSGKIVCKAGASNCNQSYGIWNTSSGIGLTIGEGVQSFNSKGYHQALYGKVKNSIKGIGYTDYEGTQGDSIIDINTSGTFLNSYLCVEFPSSSQNLLDTVSDNKPIDVRSETRGDFEIVYAHKIPFYGKGKIKPITFGETFTVSQGNAIYNVTKIKVNKKEQVSRINENIQSLIKNVQEYR